MGLELFWWGCRGEINGRDMLWGFQCVFLKKISDGKVWDAGWVGGVGRYDSTDKLGRGGVEFFYLVILLTDIHPCSICLGSMILGETLMNSLRGGGLFCFLIFFWTGRNDHLSSSYMRNPCFGLGISWIFRVTLVSCCTYEYWGTTEMVVWSCVSGLMLVTYCG